MFGCRRRFVGSLAVASLVVASSLASKSALATNRSYIGGAGTGSWDTSGNWSLFGRPAQGDNVFISPNDSLAHTVFFNPSGPLFVSYGSTIVNSQSTGTSRLFNAGFSLEGVSLTIGRNGSYWQELNGASTYLTNTILTDNGRISIPNGTFETVNFTQSNGTVEFGPYNVSGVYSMQGGTMDGTVINTGTFDFVGGKSTTGNIVNHGTLIHRGQTGSLLANVENHGTIVMDTATSFRSLRNLTSMSMTGDDSLTTTDSLNGITQGAGTFTMSGDSLVLTSRVWLDGGSWNQNDGRVVATNMFIGKPGADSVFHIGGGSTTVSNVYVGEVDASGRMVQSGGQVISNLVTLGLPFGIGSSSSTGRYDMSAGTLDTHSLIVGGKGSAGGTLTQSGGYARMDHVIINEEFASNGAVRISGGTFNAVSGSPIVNNGHIAQTGGVGWFGGVEGAGSISVSGTGSFSSDYLRAKSVDLSGNGRVRTFLTNKVNALSFDETGGAVHGQWEVMFGGLIVDYTGASPIASIKRYIKSGYAGGDWDGTGLIIGDESIPRAVRNKALGYAEASQLFGAGGGTFEGEPVDGSTVIAKFTYYGDTDLNGVINFDDYARIDHGFNSGGDTWFEGDFDYNGIVNFDDYALIDLAFNTQSAPERTSAVPEPTFAGSIVALSMIARRRRRAVESRRNSHKLFQ